MDGEFTLHEPQVYKRSMWGCKTGVRKETWYTTESKIVCFTRPDTVFLFFETLLKMEGDNVFRMLERFLCLLELLSLFYQLKGKLKWNWCLLINKIKDDEMGYNSCLLLLFISLYSSVLQMCLTMVLVIQILSIAAAKSLASVSSGGETKYLKPKI